MPFAYYVSIYAARDHAEIASRPHPGNRGCPVAVFEAGHDRYGLRLEPIFAPDTVAVFCDGKEVTSFRPDEKAAMVGTCES